MNKADCESEVAIPFAKTRMKISYRKLAGSDSKQYRKIRLESLKAYPQSYDSTFAEQSNLPKLMFEQTLEQPVDDRFVIGAFDQEDLIGICGFIPLDPDNSHDFRSAGALIQMYVRAAYSGRKIGLNLTKTVIHEAFKNPAIERIVLEVKEGNGSAIRVYRQAGFCDYHSEVINDGDRVMIIHRDD